MIKGHEDTKYNQDKLNQSKRALLITWVNMGMRSHAGEDSHSARAVTASVASTASTAELRGLMDGTPYLFFVRITTYMKWNV